MTWSFAQARQAAARIRAAPLGLEAIATIRPPSVYGLARDRAPLPLLLWIAARDGLVVEQDNGGFAVLQRPAQNRPGNPGGYRLRLLRRRLLGSVLYGLGNLRNHNRHMWLLRHRFATARHQ